MQVSYHKDHESAYQKLITDIALSPDNIFPLLATTTGVQQWFPELSVRGEKVLTFDYGKETEEDLEIYKYENPKALHFEWFGGEVEFLLEGDEFQSKVMLNQRLPLDTENLAQDFAGWQKCFENIKHISECEKVEDFKEGELSQKIADIEAGLQ